MSGKREFGDYQTPDDFALKVCQYLKNNLGITPSTIIEPTCGIGNFLNGSLIFDAVEYYGIDINSDYCKHCEERITDSRVKIINADFFKFSTKSLVKDGSHTLIIGNPPWVTNSTLSVLDSNNLPAKSNFKKLKGIDAITGTSNFDICEFMILRLIDEFRDTRTTIAMLCKTTVARNVFKELVRRNVKFDSCETLEFDATQVFGINASACVLVISLSNCSTTRLVCNVRRFESPEHIVSSFGYVEGQFLSNTLLDVDDFDGSCCYEWRQGVKHDCAKVMELTLSGDQLYNGRGEPVNIEDDIVFPLVKSSMFKNAIINSFNKYVIVTQKKVNEETSLLKTLLPRTWNYLCENLSLFENRKSIIYKNSPRFSMFGIGNYTFSKYKVGVSGFYKEPMFSVLYSDSGKPVMTDDTGYFICFDTYNDAYVSMLLLNGERVKKFLLSIAFIDSKRPYTKKVLERIDFDKIIKSTTISELIETEQTLKLPSYVTSSMYADYKSAMCRIKQEDGFQLSLSSFV